VWAKQRTQISEPLNDYHYPLEEHYRLDFSQIIQGITDGVLFGAAEVDIHVPDNLKEYFSEMTPIFKNTTVKHQDIGNYSQKYLEEQDQTFPDTRYLIGSMFGEKILLTTSLLRWYLKHGLVISKIYQFIQFKPKKCFQKFANNVSDDRRAGN